jgi:hypothetical protein
MKQLVIIVATIAFFGSASTEAQAQRLFGRLFRSQPTVTRNYVPVVQRSYSYRPSTARVPQPVTGYGSNVHRNFVIRQEQKKAAITGIPPRNRGNILWAR